MFFSTKICIVLACSFAIAMAFPANEGPLVGGQQQLSGDAIKEAEKDLQNSLNKLAAGDGPNYKISKVISGTSQVVSGRLLRLNVDLIDKDGKDLKDCKVEIWSQPWIKEDGIQVTFECPNEPRLVKKHAV